MQVLVKHSSIGYPIYFITVGDIVALYIFLPKKVQNNFIEFAPQRNLQIAKDLARCNNKVANARRNSLKILIFKRKTFQLKRIIITITTTKREKTESGNKHFKNSCVLDLAFVVNGVCKQLTAF